MTAFELKDTVQWLLADGHFKYASVTAEVYFFVHILFAVKVYFQGRSYDRKQPFGCEGITHILRLEVFATKGGANIEVFRDIV